MMMTGLKMQTSEELLALKRKEGEQIDDGELQRLPYQKALVYRIFSPDLARESKESLVRLRMDTARGFTDTKTVIIPGAVASGEITDTLADIF